MRKKYYIHPETQFIQIGLNISLLAGSPGSGGGTGSGSAEAGGGTSGGGTGGNMSGGSGGSSDAKQNPFSSWENWDEY